MPFDLRLKHDASSVPVKMSLAGYAVTDTVPQKACDSLSAFKGDGLVAIQARVVAASRRIRIAPRR